MRCGDCVYFGRVLRSRRGDCKALGVFVEEDSLIPSYAGVAYAADNGNTASFYVDEDFGCIHFKEK